MKKNEEDSSCWEWGFFVYFYYQELINFIAPPTWSLEGTEGIKWFWMKLSRANQILGTWSWSEVGGSLTLVHNCFSQSYQVHRPQVEVRLRNREHK
jgi:hypothetical protein